MKKIASKSEEKFNFPIPQKMTFLCPLNPSFKITAKDTKKMLGLTFLQFSQGIKWIKPNQNWMTNKKVSKVWVLSIFTPCNLKTVRDSIKVLKSPFWPLTKAAGGWNPQNRFHTISHTRNKCVKISKESVHPSKR